MLSLCAACGCGTAQKHISSLRDVNVHMAKLLYQAAEYARAA